MFTLDEIGIEETQSSEQTPNQNIEPGKEEIINPDQPTIVDEEDNDIDQSLLDDDKEDNPDKPVQKNPTPEVNDNISVFAKALQEEGLLEGITEDDLKNINSLADVVKYAQEKAIDSSLSTLTPTQQRYMDSLKAGIEINEFEQLEKELQSLEVLTEDTLGNDLQKQFTVIAYDLINKGMDKEEAQDLANLIVNQPNGLQKALVAKDALYQSKLKAYNDNVEVKKQDNLASVEQTKELVNSKEKVLGKVTLTKADKDKIFSNMTTRVDIIDGQQVNAFSKWRKEQGVEAEFILNTLMVLTDNFTSLGKLGISAKSAASKALEDKLRQAENSEITGQRFKVGDGDYDFNF